MQLTVIAPRPTKPPPMPPRPAQAAAPAPRSAARRHPEKPVPPADRARHAGALSVPSFPICRVGCWWRIDAALTPAPIRIPVIPVAPPAPTMPEVGRHLPRTAFPPSVKVLASPGSRSGAVAPHCTLIVRAGQSTRKPVRNSLRRGAFVYRMVKAHHSRPTRKCWHNSIICAYWSN